MLRGIRIARLSSEFRSGMLALSQKKLTLYHNHKTFAFGDCCRFSSHSPPPPPPVLPEDLVHHLERTSLVDFDNAEAIKRLSEAITFANQLFEVDTAGVEPLITVLENEPLPLRDDVVEPTNRNDVIKNASLTEEDYFVAPPGNIPLEKTSKDFLKTNLNERND